MPRSLWSRSSGGNADDGKILPGRGPHKPLNGGVAHGPCAYVGRGRIGASMVHGRAYLDARRESIEDEPARLSPQCTNEAVIPGNIFLIAVNCRRELPLQAVSNPFEFRGIPGNHDKARRPEHLFRQHIVRQEGLRIRAEECSSALRTRRIRPLLRSRHALDPLRSSQPIGAGAEAVAYAPMKHRCRFGPADVLAQGLQEGLHRFPGDPEHQSGIRAELPDAQQDRPRQFFGKGLPPSLQRGRQDEHRVDAPHLGVHRYRYGARRRRIEERASSLKRSGEAHRLHQRVPHQPQSDLVALSMQ